MTRHNYIGTCMSIHSEQRIETYIDIPPSLIIYPIPYPPAATGPKPNNLSAGLPQFEVDKIEVDNSVHPGSAKIAGIACFLWLSRRTGIGSSGVGSRLPAI